MGYTTEFSGSFAFDKEVTTELKNYINDFSRVRHMKRDNDKIKKIFPNWINQCFKGNLGLNGEYFIGAHGFMGQDKDESIIEYNYPAADILGLWCDWIIDENGELVWNESEKFYFYAEWLVYLINNFFEPEGYVLNGKMLFRGEDIDDIGELWVEDNKVTQRYYKVFADCPDYANVVEY